MSSFVTARRLAATSVAVAATSGGLAAAAQAQVIHGTVVHHNAKAQSFAVADQHGHLYAIHAAHSPRIGSVVTVTASRLRNGTYGAHATKVVGQHRGRVTLKGTVSYVNRARGTYTLSARGVSMLVHATHMRRNFAHAADALPPVGSIVTATGNVDDQGDLNDDTTQVDGTDTNGIDLEGVILAVDTNARTISVSSDDEDQGSTPIVVSVPSSIDMSAFAVGDEVELNVAPSAGGYTLLGTSDDQGAQGADDQGEIEGNQGDDNNDDNGSSSSGSGGDGSGNSGSGD